MAGLLGMLFVLCLLPGCHRQRVPKDELVVRGGGYFFSAIAQRSTNRNTLDPSMRSPGVSMRLCATLSLAKPEPARN